MLTLSNPIFNCHAYLLTMVASVFLDTVHFDNFITFEDGWVKVPAKYWYFDKF